jgi:hypothetical protein
MADTMDTVSGPQAVTTLLLKGITAKFPRREKSVVFSS